MKALPPLHFIRSWLFAAAAPMALTAANVRAQEVPEAFEMGIFEISIAELPQLTAPALVSPTGEVLVPLGIVLEQARIPFERGPGGLQPQLIDGSRQPIEGRVEAASRRIQRGDSAIYADSLELVESMGETFLALRLLAFLLEADVRVDFATLTVFIRPGVPFPAHLAAETDRRRRLAEIRMGWATERLPDAPLRPLSGGGVLRYGLSAGTPEPIRNSVLSLEGGLALVGGEAVIGFTGSPGGSGVRGPELTARYQRYVPENAWISFVRLGDVTAEAGLARFIRGLTVTNRPLRRGQFFQDLALAPDLPPGWEVEVYRNGQLIGYTDPAAPGAVTVPITYGRTELDVRMIGPAGEMVTSELLYSIPETQLPSGRAEYTAGGGRCLLADCDLVFVDADVGATRWLTLGAGYQAERDSTVQHRPTLSALAVRPGGWLAEGRFVAGQLFSLATSYRGDGPVTGSFGLDVRSPEVGRVTLLPQTDSRWTAHGDVGRGSRRVLGRLSGLTGGAVDGWGATLLTGIPGGVASAQVEDFPSRPPELTLSAFRGIPQRWLDGRYTANLRASVREDGLQTLQLGIGGVWAQRLSASLGLSWQDPYGLGVNLTFNRQFPVGQVQGLLSGGGGDEFRASVRTDGAIAIDPFHAVEPASYYGIGFGGLDLVAFYDLNGNGVRDPGEPAASEVAIRAGDRVTTSDASGHARVWGLVPYEKLGIRVSEAWGDPRWTPLDSLQVIRPVPHVFNPVELPLVGTREVVGSVIGAPGIPTTGGIGFTLTNVATGQVFRGMTMSDGAIYVSQVPVGTYSLEFSAAALETLQGRVPGAPLVVQIVGEDPDAFVVDLPPILLERLPEP